MNQDTEKALLEFVQAIAERTKGDDGGQWASMFMDRTARAYLASLEARCSCPNRIGNRVDPYCPVHRDPKPEPKRGVGDILRLVAAGLRYHASKNHGGDLEMADSIDEALRLYREERERVEKVASEMLTARSETEKGCRELYATWRELGDWAGRLLERRDAD